MWIEKFSLLPVVPMVSGSSSNSPFWGCSAVTTKFKLALHGHLIGNCLTLSTQSDLIFIVCKNVECAIQIKQQHVKQPQPLPSLNQDLQFATLQNHFVSPEHATDVPICSANVFLTKYSGVELLPRLPSGPKQNGFRN